MDKNEFLRKFNINSQEFELTGLQWEDLLAIYNDYLKRIKELKVLTNFLEECLVDIKRVHSIKKRIKDPKHVIRKIIRRKIDDPSSDININNYKEMITDLIGVRVLHLFKDDWEAIHDEIMAKWFTKETPIANIRDGDPEQLIQKFISKGCDIRRHHFGYRSVHYLILLLHNKKEIAAEIQVRTLFEEAWSEIDHRVRYPDNDNETVLREYLVIFNRLAGSADEMGSFIKLLKHSFDDQKKTLDEKISIIESLRQVIRESGLSADEKEKISTGLAKLGPHAVLKIEEGKSIENRDQLNPIILGS
jgi:putative GTP pyrophosphokinase